LFFSCMSTPCEWSGTLEVPGVERVGTCIDE
jgi:hypothetical protein